MLKKIFETLKILLIVSSIALKHLSVNQKTSTEKCGIAQIEQQLLAALFLWYALHKFDESYRYYIDLFSFVALRSRRFGFPASHSLIYTLYVMDALNSIFLECPGINSLIV
jgi:hypothetical protein